MDDFNYRQGVLHCEDVPAEAIAQAVGTPCYVYSRATLLGHYDRLAAAFAPLSPLICYAIKSCANVSICRLLARRGAGMDLVSGGELHRALLAGVDPGRCVYAGVGKTDAEIAQAIEAGVGWFNVESQEEFETISRIARRLKRKTRAALRVNPDVDPHTHRYTTTGKRENKFGVDIEQARAFFQTYGGDEACRPAGIHLHLGSPIYSAAPYVESIGKALALIDDLEGIGHRIEALNLGGGFGADYESHQSPAAVDYARDIVPLLESRVREGLSVILEPGRSITANAGILLLRVLFTKRTGEKKFVICDGGMNVLIRPSHYGAFHFIWPARVSEAMVPASRRAQVELAGLEKVDVVGPICESGDFLATDRDLPPLRRGDLLAVFSTGAYGMVMASRYNGMPLPPEVLIDGARVQLIRKRETYEDLTDHEMEIQEVKLAPLQPVARLEGDRA